jgi:nucleoside-diphosphate-sugar epimerase
MRVFIVGAGLVGCYAAQSLVSRGDEVAFYDISPSEKYIRGVVGEKYEVFRGDVRELPTIIDAIKQFAPDAVIHTTALIGNLAQSNPYRGFTVNVGGCINIAEAVRLSGIKRLVYASTQGVNDLSREQAVPIDESFPIGGLGTVYSNSKVACEQILQAYAISYQLELAIMRLGGVYGYGHFAGGSGVGRTMCDMLAAAEEGKHAPIGPGIPETYELVYAKDVGEAVALAVHAKKLAHDVFNVGSGKLYATEDVVAALQEVVPNATASRSAPPRPDRNARVQPLDLRRSKKELGYIPKFDLVAGLRDLSGEMKRLAL